MYGMDSTPPARTGQRQSSPANNNNNNNNSSSNLGSQSTGLGGGAARRHPPLREHGEDTATRERGLLPLLALQLCRELAGKPGAQAVLAGDTTFYYSKYSSNNSNAQVCV